LPGADAAARRHRRDGQPARKVAGVRDILERAGAQLCHPPPYSPDLNPIENAFAKLKTLIRSAAERTLSMACNSRLEKRLTPSPKPSAKTTSGMPVMRKTDRERR
jgi:transposase